MSGYWVSDRVVFNKLFLQLTWVNFSSVGQTSSSIFIKFPNDVTFISNPSTFPLSASIFSDEVKNLAA